MASFVKAGFGRDLNQARLDLDSVGIGLGKLVSERAKEKLTPILSEVRALLPYDSTHRGWDGFDPSWKAKRDPGHIRDSVKGGTLGNTLTVYSSHPGGPTHWWSGTISPKGHPLTIHHLPGAGQDFVSKTADRVGRDVADALDRLCAEHGL